MCGLVGVAGNLEYKDEALMKRLLIFDYLRGPDSTGMAAIAINGDAKIAKIASHPIDLADTAKFKDICKGSTSKAFLGHNRLATRGGVNAVNAHPYHYGHIIGAHNGTLEYSCKAALEAKLEEKFDVDSQALYAAIAAFGIEETISMIKEGKDSHSGAWALTWYDQTKGTINFLRNQHRPLWYGWSKDFKKIIWGSTWQIADAAAREGTSPFEGYVEDKTNYRYWSFDPDVHYELDVAVLRQGGTAPVKFKCKEIKGKEPVASTGTTGNDPFGRNGNQSTTSMASGTRLTTTFHSPSKKEKPVNLIQLLGTNSSPFSGWISRSDFTEMAKYGCSWCQKPVDFQMPGITVMTGVGVVLCPTCSGNHDGATNATTKIYVKGASIDAFQK
jgi:predicted glutamine amidotransferase